MLREDIAIKKLCTPEMTHDIRLVLYNRYLTWGAKILALAILDSPLNKKIKNAVLARRLSVTPSQIIRWQKQLRKAGFIK